MLSRKWEFSGHAARALPDDTEKADAICASENAPSLVLGQIGFELLVTLSFVVAVNAALVFLHIG